MFLKGNEAAEDTLSFTIDIPLLTGEEGDTTPIKPKPNILFPGHKISVISQLDTLRYSFPGWVGALPNTLNPKEVRDPETEDPLDYNCFCQSVLLPCLGLSEVMLQLYCQVLLLGNQFLLLQQGLKLFLQSLMFLFIRGLCS